MRGDRSGQTYRFATEPHRTRPALSGQSTARTSPKAGFAPGSTTSSGSFQCRQARAKQRDVSQWPVALSRLGGGDAICDRGAANRLTGNARRADDRSRPGGRAIPARAKAHRGRAPLRRSRQPGRTVAVGPPPMPLARAELRRRPPAGQGGRVGSGPRGRPSTLPSPGSPIVTCPIIAPGHAPRRPRAFGTAGIDTWHRSCCTQTHTHT